MKTRGAARTRWGCLSACAAFIAVTVSTFADAGESKTPVGVVAGADAVAAFRVALAADAAIGSLLVEGRMDELVIEARRMKEAIETMRTSVRVTDRATSQRVQSATKESLVLADRLVTVAATGNRARARTVYHNLHRYVEFVAKHLPADLTAETGSEGGGS